MVNGLFTVVMELFEPLKENKLCSCITAIAKQHCFIKNLYYFFTCSFLPLLTHQSLIHIFLLVNVEGFPAL